MPEKSSRTALILRIAIAYRKFYFPNSFEFLLFVYLIQNKINKVATILGWKTNIWDVSKST
jgi:hypothetical protein